MLRHENMVTRDRKSPSTGSGRAWNETEEAYLLHSRLNKMPYKHIAAHLNKTELACRLHYHQLSRGSTRRKRDVSPSSSSSDATPRGRAAVPCSSPVYRGHTRSLSPSVMGSPYLPRSVTSDAQLFSRPGSVEPSPRLPALLPKSDGLAYAPYYAREESPRYLTRTPESEHYALPPVLPPRFGSPASPWQSTAAAPRLDTWSRPWSPPAPAHSAAPLELPRLDAIYEKHKNAFWAVVADEYGMNASPVALEQAWRSGTCCQGSRKPLTPMASPDKDRGRLVTPDVTRISSIIHDD
ncbi:hypothetical protein E4U42_006772 [Claviceps africana]|uniref:Myb-like domain-containing protein n=1 Tax=Claviceps africana TaxID=83212 RepID=A0A8K0NEU7_9HYPO|nr:hypothetical protein E4U42_006772 [Claviceps africana]